MKEKIIENNINFENIINLEKYLLNSFCWKINLITPYEISISIILANINLLEKTSFEEFSSSCLDFLKFSNNNFSIYKQYNPFIITVSCLFLVSEIYNEENFINFIKNFYLEKINLRKEILEIKKCCIFIKIIADSEDNIHNNYDSNNNCDIITIED